MASTLARCQGTGFEPEPMPQRGQRGEDEAASRQSVPPFRPFCRWQAAHHLKRQRGNALASWVSIKDALPELSLVRVS